MIRVRERRLGGEEKEKRFKPFLRVKLGREEKVEVGRWLERVFCKEFNEKYKMNRIEGGEDRVSVTRMCMVGG
jgi:hypothetical protein